MVIWLPKSSTVERSIKKDSLVLEEYLNVDIASSDRPDKSYTAITQQRQVLSIPPSFRSIPLIDTMNKFVKVYQRWSMVRQNCERGKQKKNYSYTRMLKDIKRVPKI